MGPYCASHADMAYSFEGTFHQPVTLTGAMTAFRMLHGGCEPSEEVKG